VCCRSDFDIVAVIKLRTVARDQNRVILPYPLKAMTCTGCLTRYRIWHFFNNSNINKDIATKQTHTTDTFLFISHTTNVFRFKFRCNIFIRVRINKEMPGSLASRTPCIIVGLLRRETVGLFSRSYVCKMALIEPFSSYSVDVKHHRIYTKKVVKSYLQYRCAAE